MWEKKSDAELSILVPMCIIHLEKVCVIGHILLTVCLIISAGSDFLDLMFPDTLTVLTSVRSDQMTMSLGYMEYSHPVPRTP